MTTPAWSAPQSGIPGNLAAANASAQVNQLLGAHAEALSYTGMQVLTPTGSTQFTWLAEGNATDLDQPFTLSGTSVGRVVLPVTPVGNGADMLVTLYPDNGSGSPNTAVALASTLVPASYITQVAAPNGLTAGGPLANEQNNGAYFAGGVANTPWSPSAADAGGVSIATSFTSSADWIIGIGGNNLVTGAALAGVTATQYLGGGSIALPVPQPPLPVATALTAPVICGGSIVAMGGGTGAAGLAQTAAVWAASWDGNNGIIGSWSAQTALPAASLYAGAATYGSSVYYVGGTVNFPTPISTVYYNTLNNGQLGAWITGPPFPTPVLGPLMAAIDGWLIVMGGVIDDSSTVTAAVWYAQINSNGSLGPWQAGPSLPTANSAFSPGSTVVVADNVIALICGQGNSALAPINAIQTLTVTADGLAPQWRSSVWPEAEVFPAAAFATGGGVYDVIALDSDQSVSQYSQLVSVPLLSVPLYATGLTNGGKYHVVLRQHQGATAADYLQWGILNGSPLPFAALSSPRRSGTWSTVNAGWSVPMAVYDTSASGDLLHVSADPNAYAVYQQWTSLLYNSMNLLVGELDVTLKPNGPLNANPTFTSGVSPWTATGGTLTQSAVQTHGGFPFSGLLTPSGAAGTASISSELLPVQQGNGPFYGSSSWYLADGWFYSTPGTTTFSFSVAWYDRLGTLLSTSSTVTTLAAATWTHVQNYVQAPADAAQARLMPSESGTPSSSKVIYVSNAYLVQSPECVGAFTSAATVDYATGPWPPTSVTQLL